VNGLHRSMPAVQGQHNRRCSGNYEMAAAGEAHPERSDEPLDPGAERRRQGANHLGNAGRGRSFCPGQGHGFLLPLLPALWPRPEG